MKRISRRTFISAGLTLTGVSAAALALREEGRTGVLLSAFEDARGEQYIGGLSLDEARAFGVRAPQRAHGVAVDPRDPQRVIFFARRPGAHAFEMDLGAMRARLAFATPEGRHLAGHGVFSKDGAHLFTAEHDFERARGVIAVRDARSFAIEAEIDSQGLDPHEIAWLPDGRTLLVANGGILTHPRTYRRKLNIATMDPSLCALDVRTGRCIDQQRLPDHLLSIRHLAVAADGSAVAGLQYEGARERTPGLVAVWRMRQRLELLEIPEEKLRELAGYVASVAVSDAANLIAATCPYGAGVVCWSLRDRAFVNVTPAQEAYGLSPLADGSLVASQRDGAALLLEQRRRRPRFFEYDSVGPLRWDDHWIAVASA